MPRGTPGSTDRLPAKDGQREYEDLSWVPAPPPDLPSPVFNLPTPDPVILNTATPPATNQVTLSAARQGDPEPYIFGRCIAEGEIIAGDDTGDFLYLDVLWSVGEIDYLEGLYFDGTSEGRTDQLGKAQHFDGTATQSASTIMTALKGSYDALLNKAHSVLFMLTSHGLDVKALIRGVKVIDPRVSPQSAAYSTNPALALAHMLTAAGYSMNWPSVSTAADYCDELIHTPQVKRWEIGGQIKLRKDVRRWVHALASYASCFVDMRGGEVYLVPDAPRSSNHTVTADDMNESTVRVYYAGGRNVPSAVTVNGKTVDGEPIAYPYGTSGGAGTEATLNMPFFQTGHTIGRKAEETYRKAQNNLTLEFVGFDDGIIRTLGDVGTITNAQYGLSSQLMALIEQKQVGPGRWYRKYYQYDASNYSDVKYTVTTNSTSLFNPLNPPSGPTPTATEELFTSGGVTRARFKIEFTGISWAYLKDYTVLAVATDNGIIVLQGTVDPLGVTTHTTYTTGPLISGTTYRIEVRVRSNMDAQGNPGTVEVLSGLGTNASLSYGELTNMHVYTLDGDGVYCTTSEKTGSPLTGQTWANRFTSSPLGAWSAGETWLGNQTCETVFQTEVWDSGQTWSGGWKFTDLDISELGGATRANFVALSDAVSPLSFTDYSGVLKSGQARYMKAKCIVTDSPLSAGDGLHVKLPVPVDFSLGT